MKNHLLAAVAAVGMFLSATPASAATYHRHYSNSHYRYVQHRRHMKTAKRVGIGAAGGAVVGGLIGHGKGAAIGAVAGAGAGAVYDSHQKNHGHN